MDDRIFDGLTRGLTVLPTRRSLLQVLGAFGVALVAAERSRPSVWAKKKHKGKRHRKKKKGKQNRCPGNTSPCRGGCLTKGLKCCPASTDGISGLCIDEYPVCCPSSQNGGCCPAAYPLCCAKACCASGDVCTPDGFCLYGL